MGSNSHLHLLFSTRRLHRELSLRGRFYEDQRGGGPLNVGRGGPRVVVSSHSLCWFGGETL
jgi:hypothetical protein